MRVALTPRPSHTDEGTKHESSKLDESAVVAANKFPFASSTFSQLASWILATYADASTTMDATLELTQIRSTLTK